jgi:hypothetical protein
MIDGKVRLLQVLSTIAADSKNAFYPTPARIPPQALKPLAQRLYDRLGHAFAGHIRHLPRQPVRLVALDV